MFHCPNITCYRYLGNLKSYVRNKTQPEGSIAEGYHAQEVLTFCSSIYGRMKTRSNRPSRVDDYANTNYCHLSTLFPPIGRIVSGSSTFELSTVEKTQEHRYVLFNCPEVKPYIQ